MGAAGVATSRLLAKVGDEIFDRILSPREKQRVGGLIAIAADGIQKRLHAGESIRDDGFFNANTYGRSDAEEVAENIILEVQRDAEEKKLPYMGYFLSTIPFDSNISPEMAHQITSYSERFTYRQFCLLKIFGVDSIRLGLRDSDYRNEDEILVQRRQILYECFDFARKYLIVSESYILGVTDLCPRATRTQGLGADMFNLMNLKSIPGADLRPVIDQLS